MNFITNAFLKTGLGLVFVFLISVGSVQAGFLYVLNQQNNAANQIYCFTVNEATGALTAVSGFPVATGGNGLTGTQSELLTIDRLNSRLYVINRGSNTVSAFAVSKVNGALSPLPYSPFAVVTNAVTLAVHPSGSPLVVGGNTGSPIAGVYRADSYNVTGSSATAAAGSSYVTGGARPFSSVFSRSGSYYYTGGGLSVTFAGFSVDQPTGVLTTLPGSPYNVGSPNTLGFAADTAGRLFTANRADQTLRVFTTLNGVPTAVSAPPTATPFIGLTDAVLSPNGQFYVVLDSSSNQVAAYQISGTGANTTLTDAGLASTDGSTSNTLVFNQAGSLLFTANSASRNISKLDFNSSTGAAGNLVVQPADTAGSSGFLAGMDYIDSVPTGASGSLGGRVISGGKGLSGARVELTGTGGATRTVLTNAFGGFSFAGIETGATYIVNVSAKRYTFAPQVVSVTDNISDLVFAAQ